MRRTVLLAGMLLCVVALGSDSPKEYDDRTTINIEGTWLQTAFERDGKKNTAFGDLLTVRGGTLTYILSDGQKMQGRYCINPTRKPPHLDWIPMNGEYEGKTIKSIYQIDGDTLRIAAIAVEFEARRPLGLNDKGVFVETYERVK